MSSTLPVLEYDEDNEEAFTGPSFLEEEYYDNEGYDEDEYDDEQSAAQRDDPSNAGLVSQNTQLGAAPGTPEAGVPGRRDFEPVEPPQSRTVTGENKTVIEFASSGETTPLQLA